jgi:hypothetical protein
MKSKLSRSIVYAETERDPARYCLFMLLIPIMLIASYQDQRPEKRAG